MYSKILVPLDGSPIAENALPYARAFARGLQVPVDLLYVIDLADIERNVSIARGQFLDTLAEDEARRRREYLGEIAKSFAGGRVQCKVAKGDAANVIVESAAAEKDTLVCMATHGRSGLDRWLLGSVAEKVVRATSADLLLIRASEGVATDGEKKLDGVIVPLDGSSLAEQVLPSVTDLAKKLDLEMILFRAYTVPYGVYDVGASYAIDLERLSADIEAEVQQYLDEKRSVLRKASLEKISYASKEGLSADEIIKYGRKNPNKLIAMCSHGRSGVKRWVLGSVTETVVRHCGDPVLIVRASK
ncbi:MAG TPA: universal stress protein [Acidobacteriota bacterium]|nr:universal stress protein [Acidobacteriota bacterium]